MSFNEVFAEQRSTRNISVGEFHEVTGLNPVYIYAIERKNMLPTMGKLETLTAYLAAVAVDQGADPEQYVSELYTAWWESQLGRLGMEPDEATSTAEFIMSS